MTLTAVSSVECQGPELARVGSRDYRKKMEQRVEIELEEDMGLRVDFFFKMEEITVYLYAGCNDPVEAKLMIQKRGSGYGLRCP